MQASQTPTLVPLAFAANGTKNTIPEASQIGITNGAASLNDGFPPLCSTPIAAGGVPPAGADFNGILNLITASIRWAHGGGRYAFSSSFAADANVSGYPQGAQLMSADLLGTWISTADGNTNNPDTLGTNWVPGHSYGVTPITGLTNANVTLTPAQAAKSKITLAGALTANVQIIFPTWTKEWEVVNNTTGAFTVTAKTAAGTGIALAAGQQKITGDGTNITQPAESIAAATQSQHAVQMGQLYGGLKGISRFTTSGSLVVPAGVTTMYLSGCAGGAGGGAGGPGSVSSTAAWASGGGGGGAGQAIIRQAFTVVPGSTITVTIGAAGTGGAGSGTNPGNSGTAGGNTVVSGTGFNGGSTLTLLPGGGGGGGNATATAGQFPTGGGAGSGAPPGAYGNDAGSSIPSGAGGTGGSGPFGGAGAGARTASSGLAGSGGSGFGVGGGGGSGVYVPGSGNGGTGGAGTPGLMIFEW